MAPEERAGRPQHPPVAPPTPTPSEPHRTADARRTGADAVLPSPTWPRSTHGSAQGGVPAAKARPPAGTGDLMGRFERITWHAFLHVKSRNAAIEVVQRLADCHVAGSIRTGVAVRSTRAGAPLDGQPAARLHGLDAPLDGASVQPGLAGEGRHRRPGVVALVVGARRRRAAPGGRCRPRASAPTPRS
jgi:hypothetical protein